MLLAIFLFKIDVIFISPELLQPKGNDWPRNYYGKLGFFVPISGKKYKFTCALLIEASKCISDHIFRVCAIELLPKHGEEHGEVNGSRSFHHHGLQVLISWIFP